MDPPSVRLLPKLLVEGFFILVSSSTTCFSWPLNQSYTSERGMEQIHTVSLPTIIKSTTVYFASKIWQQYIKLKDPPPPPHTHTDQAFMEDSQHPKVLMVQHDVTLSQQVTAQVFGESDWLFGVHWLHLLQIVSMPWNFAALVESEPVREGPVEIEKRCTIKELLKNLFLKATQVMENQR